MNKKGGMLTTVILVVVAFLIGTFAGWQIIGNLTGKDIQNLSPGDEISDEGVMELYQERFGEQEGSGAQDIGIEGYVVAVENLSSNSTNLSS